MKHVLIVDDERQFLRTLTDGLRPYAQQFTVHTAGQGKQALSVLGQHPIDLLVTDLKMPEMDGFTLLAEVSKRYPRVAVMVMTAHGSPTIEENLRKLGACRYLEKPLDLDGFVQTLQEVLQGSSNGHLTGITLAAFAQLVELERKTCCLSVQSGHDRGQLHFEDGRLVGARCGNADGELAAMELLTWTESAIDIEAPRGSSGARIELPLSFILMESMRLQDEKSQRTQAPPAPTPAPSAAAIAASAPQGAVGQPGEKESSTERRPAMPTSSTEVLADLLKVPGIDAVVVVGRDGFVIESAGSSNRVNLESLGASLAHAINGIEEMGEELRVQKFQDLFIEYGSAVILCKPVGGSIAALLTPDASKLGIIRHKAKPKLDELAHFF
jgi:CheY-like chemotaxis protein/predicted regulator of Ras-like GTPase activity (Roadblock/LC7/MglB family)